MNRLIRALLPAAIASTFLPDLWVFSLRCASSPAIDWSRLGFVLVIQAAIVAVVWFTREEFVDRLPGVQLRYVLFAAGAVFLSFVFVRYPLLLSDTIRDKYFESGSYSCPRVPEFWRMGASK